MSPEQFARRPLRGARCFVVGALYPGYSLDGKETTKIREWLDEFRFWQTKLGSPYTPYLGYRFDLATYSQEPSIGWQALDSAYVRVPRAAIEAKRDAFRRAGWRVYTVERFAAWEPKLRRVENGVELAALPYCKGQGRKGELLQKRCASLTAIVDPQKIMSHAIPHCLTALRSFGVAGLFNPCKRGFYSPNRQGSFKSVFGPGPGDSQAGGPLLAPPFEYGYWDAAWIQLARALREEGVPIVKEERPVGYPDRSGATWLPEDLRTWVTDEQGPEKL